MRIKGEPTVHNKQKARFKTKNTLITLFAFILLFAFFAAVTFETLHIGHEEHCHEESCPVCLLLQIIHCTFRSVKLIRFFPEAFSACHCLSIVTLFSSIFLLTTLVSQKIKLVI